MKSGIHKRKHRSTEEIYITVNSRLFSGLMNQLFGSIKCQMNVDQCCPKPKMKPSVLFCPQPKDLQFTVIEALRTEKDITFRIIKIVQINY